MTYANKLPTYPADERNGTYQDELQRVELCKAESTHQEQRCQEGNTNEEPEGTGVTTAFVVQRRQAALPPGPLRDGKALVMNQTGYRRREVTALDLAPRRSGRGNTEIGVRSLARKHVHNLPFTSEHGSRLRVEGALPRLGIRRDSIDCLRKYNGRPPSISEAASSRIAVYGDPLGRLATLGHSTRTTA